MWYMFWEHIFLNCVLKLVLSRNMEEKWSLL